MTSDAPQGALCEKPQATDAHSPNSGGDSICRCGETEIVVHINRGLGLKMVLRVETGATIRSVKSQLIQMMVTDTADSTSFDLRTSSGESLVEDDILPKHPVELEVCEPDSVRGHIAQAHTSLVDVVTTSGAFEGLKVPGGCTVSQWKEYLSTGELLDHKVLYVSKLKFCTVIEGIVDKELDDMAALPLKPASFMVCGPHSVLQMLEAALCKKLGKPPNTARIPQHPPVDNLPLQATGRDSVLEYSFLGLQGQRASMENRVCAILNLEGTGHQYASLFGVFDGHGGDKVADLVARHLPDIVADQLHDGRDPKVALTNAFSIADRDLQRSNGSHMFDIMGSTATVILIVEHSTGKRQAFCANAGDSRAVLCRSGKTLGLSRDHKPGNPRELDRIQAAGGSVNSAGRIVTTGGEGGVNLSRAFGDFAYKSRSHLSAVQQQVISCPEVSMTDIKRNDDFLLLASDGVFEGMSSQDVVVQVSRLLASGESPENAVQEIVKQALPSGDNCTVCLVCFLST